MTRHLALDLGLRTTGVCWDFDAWDAIPCPPHLTGGERLTWWRDTFRGLMLSSSQVVVEGPFIHHIHVNGAGELFKLHGVLEELCHAEGLPYHAVAPSVIKKHATGRGNTNKAEMLDAVRMYYGYDGKDHNAADAIALWHWWDKEGRE